MIDVGSRVEFIDTPNNIRIYLPAGSLGTVVEKKIGPTGWQLRSRGITGFVYYVVQFDIWAEHLETVQSYEVRELNVLDRLARET